MGIFHRLEEGRGERENVDLHKCACKRERNDYLLMFISYYTE